MTHGLMQSTEKTDPFDFFFFFKINQLNELYWTAEKQWAKFNSQAATGQGLTELKGTAPAEIQPTQTGPEPALSKLQQ